MADHATIQRTTVIEAAEFVEYDLRGNRHLVETHEFLNNIFTLSALQMVEEVPDEMQEQELLRQSPEPRWVNFPQSANRSMRLVMPS